MYSILLLASLSGAPDLPAIHSSCRGAPVGFALVPVFKHPLLARTGCAGAAPVAATGCHGYAFPRLHELRARVAERPRLHLTVSRPVARTGCAGTVAAVPPPVKKIPEPPKK